MEMSFVNYVTAILKRLNTLKCIFLKINFHTPGAYIKVCLTGRSMNTGCFFFFMFDMLTMP